MNGEVLIVDEFTGRLLAGRRYNEGMHQAIEAKEGVEIKQENQTLATITLQNFFRLYDKLAGMTGTAMTEAAEFDQIYKLGVVPIPTNRRRPAAGPDRPRLQDRGGQVRGRRRRHRRAARARPADPGRHGRASRSPSCCRAAAAPRHPARGPQREVPRAGSRDRRPGRAQGRGHRGHQHGRPRHRHHARRQPRVHRRPRAARPRPLAGRRPRGATRPRGPTALEKAKQPSPPSTRRSSSSAASTCSAPSGTSRAASTTSCVVAPAARATPASPGSTCRCRTT